MLKIDGKPNNEAHIPISDDWGNRDTGQASQYATTTSIDTQERWQILTARLVGSPDLSKEQEAAINVVSTPLPSDIVLKVGDKHSEEASRPHSADARAESNIQFVQYPTNTASRRHQ